MTIKQSQAVSIGKLLKDGNLSFGNIDEKLLIDAKNSLGDDHELAPVIVDALNYYNFSINKFLQFTNACNNVLKN
ncbi:MAG: hypothetical protein PHS49_06605 [Candidatus Gracilibacteria bacterium]|nr:hypothetical protein [Candidatus Gracilibacteria bacterium]